MARDTSTGKEYEEIVAMCIARSCNKNNLDYKAQSHVGEKPGGGKHKVDWELIDKSDVNRRALLSCKTQSSSGTAEEKLAYEVIKLVYTMDSDPRYKHAWVVLGGTGWSSGMKKFAKEKLVDYVPSMRGRVSIISTDDLISMNINIPI
jgi:hypothetical protein